MKKNSQAFNSYIEQDYLSTTTENNENKSQTQSDDYSFLNEFTKKATSQDQQTDNKKFVAILENRTREIGLACFKSDFAHLSILEYPDSQTYSYTVLHLSQIEPSAIILPANAINLPLSLLLQRMFPEAIVSPMSRKFFNDVVGMHMLSQFTVDDAKTLEAYSASHYLSFGAAAAILKYIEIRTSIVFFPKSIKIHFIAPASHMLMDGRTIDVLEVVRSQGNGNCGNRRMDCGSYWSGHIQGDRPKEAATNKGSFPGQKRLGKIRKLVPSEGLSLFSFLNHTGTAMGSRLLRSSLIQPLTDLDTINSRLDAVGELLQFPQRMTTSPSETPSSTPISESSKSSSTFSSCFSFDTLLPSISAILSKIPDLDRIVSHFVYQHKKENMTLFQRGIRAFMHLDTILTLLPSLCELLKPFESSLICSIRANLSAPFFQEMKEKIQQIFVSSAFPTRGAWNGITQLAALIRPQVSSVIDVSRQVNEETMEDLRSLLLSYQSVYSLPSLRMHYGAKRGVYLSVSNEDVKNLPAIFEQRVKIGAKRTSCTTEEVASLGERCRRSLNDIIIHSYKIVRTLEDDVRANVGVLYRLTESIALLDMIVSFAIVASSYQGYVRPDLTYDGPIAVKQGRHPLRDIMLQSEYVPNNIFITDTRSILLLSGANMSGKTSILHLICSLSILAQVGSFIPADFASLRVFDHIFAHLGEKEGIESITRSSYGAVARNLLASSSIPSSASASSNSYRSSSANSSYRSSGSISSYLPNPSSPSSFLSEMRDIAFILSSYTSRSLIVIDELGRATNDREGFGIAWAVLEEFATKDEKEVREENDRMSSFSQFGKSVRDIPDSSDLSVGSTPQSCFSSASINPIVLFTTHYPELTNIEKYYSNIVNVHMEAIRLEESHPSTSSWNQSHLSDGSSGFAIQTHSGGTQTPMKLKFTYRLEYGPAQFADCGIDIARIAGFPRSVIDKSLQIKERLLKKKVDSQADNSNQSLAVELGERILLLQHSSLTKNELRRYLIELKRLTGTFNELVKKDQKESATDTPVKTEECSDSIISQNAQKEKNSSSTSASLHQEHKVSHPQSSSVSASASASSSHPSEITSSSATTVHTNQLQRSVFAPRLQRPEFLTRPQEIHLIGRSQLAQAKATELITSSKSIFSSHSFSVSSSGIQTETDANNYSNTEIHSPPISPLSPLSVTFTPSSPALRLSSPTENEHFSLSQTVEESQHGANKLSEKDGESSKLMTPACSKEEPAEPSIVSNPTNMQAEELDIFSSVKSSSIRSVSSISLPHPSPIRLSLPAESVEIHISQPLFESSSSTTASTSEPVQAILPKRPSSLAPCIRSTRVQENHQMQSNISQTSASASLRKPISLFNQSVNSTSELADSDHPANSLSKQQTVADLHPVTTLLAQMHKNKENQIRSLKGTVINKHTANVSKISTLPASSPSLIIQRTELCAMSPSQLPASPSAIPSDSFSPVHLEEHPDQSSSLSSSVSASTTSMSSPPIDSLSSTPKQSEERTEQYAVYVVRLSTDATAEALNVQNEQKSSDKIESAKSQSEISDIPISSSLETFYKPEEANSEKQDQFEADGLIYVKQAIPTVNANSIAIEITNSQSRNDELVQNEGREVIEIENIVEPSHNQSEVNLTDSTSVAASTSVDDKKDDLFEQQNVFVSGNGIISEAKSLSQQFLQPEE